MKEKIIKETIEECCELATVLMQYINKPGKDLEKDIINEIADVMVCLEELAIHYDIEEIHKKISIKNKKIK
jgi:NTP pyrophosphatase (non-canonical NTP hydrolase)|tara:strand:- start:511 stop:723 length:213 start_codon:yes stop_codon:yes gene_type:complete